MAIKSNIIHGFYDIGYIEYYIKCITHLFLSYYYDEIVGVFKEQKNILQNIEHLVDNVNLNEYCVNGNSYLSK